MRIVNISGARLAAVIIGSVHKLYRPAHLQPLLYAFPGCVIRQNIYSGCAEYHLHCGLPVGRSQYGRNKRVKCRCYSRPVPARKWRGAAAVIIAVAYYRRRYIVRHPPAYGKMRYVHARAGIIRNFKTI
jgi:hypothetical protein